VTFVICSDPTLYDECVQAQSCNAKKKLKQLEQNIVQQNDEWEMRAREEDKARAKRQSTMVNQALIQNSKPKATKAKKKADEKKARAEKLAATKLAKDQEKSFFRAARVLC
jgi:hypothetical protein